MVVLAVAIATVVLENVGLRAFFPHLHRFTTDFSSAYLQRELGALAAAPPQVVFLGDSVLWGYALPADQTAVSMLTNGGCPCRNLAFKAGGPVNEYALALLLKARGIRPRSVVLEVNQRAFNASDATNSQLHPAIAALAEPLLLPSDRTILSLPPVSATPGQRAERILDRLSTLYAMRSDIRETLLGTNDALPAKALTAADFEGTYDLQALDDDNVAVHFLAKAVTLFHSQQIPVVAFMTPVNHALVHRYVDTPEYRANGVYLQHVLQRSGARVLDLDTAFPSRDFLDNVHLTPHGQVMLAAIFTKENLR